MNNWNIPGTSLGSLAGTRGLYTGTGDTQHTLSSHRATVSELNFRRFRSIVPQEMMMSSTEISKKCLRHVGRCDAMPMGSHWCHSIKTAAETDRILISQTNRKFSEKHLETISDNRNGDIRSCQNQFMGQQSSFPTFRGIE